jgi:hypothetical protein
MSATPKKKKLTAAQRVAAWEEQRKREAEAYAASWPPGTRVDLQRGDPREYEGLPVREAPSQYPEWSEKCSKCAGHGQWITTYKAYRDGQHAIQICGACWGWGWHKPGECEHDWSGGRECIGNCLHIWTCAKCGLRREVDSSG